MTNFNVNSQRRAKRTGGDLAWALGGPGPFALYLPPLFMFILICPNVLAAGTNDLFWPLSLYWGGIFFGSFGFGFRLRLRNGFAAPSGFICINEIDILGSC